MSKFDLMCTYAFVHGGAAVKNAGCKLRQRIDDVKNDESGMEIIAVILIIVVVVALAVVFKDNIINIFNKLWSKIFDTLNGGENGKNDFSGPTTVDSTKGFAELINYIP